jgi:hypothetical protein
MVLTDQAVEINRSQFDLVTLGLEQARRSLPGCIALRPRLIRQIVKQFLASHP